MDSSALHRSIGRFVDVANFKDSKFATSFKTAYRPPLKRKVSSRRKNPTNMFAGRRLKCIHDTWNSSQLARFTNENALATHRVFLRLLVALPHSCIIIRFPFFVCARKSIGVNAMAGTMMIKYAPNGMFQGMDANSRAANERCS